VVRGHRVDAGLVDRGVFFDGESGVSCAGGNTSYYLIKLVVFDVRV